MNSNSGRSNITISLAALAHNISQIRGRLSPDTALMAVVKDNAYGHGMEGIARFLETRVDWFCVARVQEGVELRLAGSRRPILVFEIPAHSDFPLYEAYNLKASVCVLDTLKAIPASIPFHINIDTGMHRLGLSPEEVPDALRLIDERKMAGLEGIYTHFATAETPNHPYVEEQLRRFKELRSQFPAELFTHAANTGAIFNQPRSRVLFDGVRPGVALFGFNPGDPEHTLKPILRFHSELIKVRKVKEGEPIGYGGIWRAPNDGYIGIVPTGYAFGVARSLSGKICFLIDDSEFPVVGNITMDYTTLFLGENRFEEGKQVCIISDERDSVREWARILGTIPYEITTRFPAHIPRHYE